MIFYYKFNSFSFSGKNKKSILLTFCLWGAISMLNAQILYPEANKYAFNNSITSIVKDSMDNTYIGGEFTSVSLWSGHFANLNGTTSELNSNFPKVLGGQVNSVVAIPSGGWYIGGTFTQVNGIVRNRLARINADGSLHAFNPNLDGDVSSLVIDGTGNLYAGGAFSTVGGITRNYMCQFDNTGVLTSFNPDMNYYIYALALDASGNLYAGGAFSTVGGITRNNLCKFDNTGALTTFNPNMNNPIYTLAVDGNGSLYAGGDFTYVGGISRNRLCQFNVSGVLTAFNPDMNNFVLGLVLDSGGNLYIGGNFTYVGGISRNRLCKLDNNGNLTAFNPDMNNWVKGLALDNVGNLYAGGAFTTVGGVTRNYLCKFDNTSTLTTFDPNMNDIVRTLVLDNSGNVYAGGVFATVGGSITRNRLCKLDSLGNLTAFNPDMNDFISVLSLDGNGNLYAGGAFTTVGGVTRNRLCKFDNTDALTTFNPDINGPVIDLAFENSGNLYVGGNFTSVGGITRNRLCQFNASESLTAFNPDMNDIVRALALDSSENLYVGGFFTTVGGITRNRLCQFDNTGTLTTFNPDMSDIVRALALDSSGNLYVGGGFTTVGGASRNRLCQFDNTGALTAFDPNINNLIYALAVDGNGSLYAGGDFTSVGGTNRNRFCKFDNMGGLTTFNPNMNSWVRHITFDGSGNLYAGGLFTNPSYSLAIFAPIPIISSFTPASGCAGLSTATITGTGFAGTTAVSIGGTPVNAFTVNSPTEIVLTVGNGTTGTVSVTTRGGLAVSSGTFTVNFNVGTPSFTAGAAAVCSGGTSTYTATADHAVGITYSILNGTGAAIDMNTGEVSNVTGNFVVVTTATGPCGNPTTTNRAITVKPFDIDLVPDSDSTKANGTLVSCAGPYTIYYRRLSGANTSWLSINTPNTSFTLTSLAPASNYVAYAVNANNVTTGFVYVTTSGQLPCGPAITGVTASINCNRLIVNWTAVPGTSLYRVCYRVISPTMGTPINNNTGTNSINILLGQNTYNTTIEVTVFRVCNNQYTPASAPISVVMGVPSPQGTPQLSFSNITCTGFNVSWAPIPEAQNYRVQLLNGTNVNRNFIVNLTSTPISGIVPNFTYGVRVIPLGCNNLVGTMGSKNVQTCTGLVSRMIEEDEQTMLSVYPNPGDGLFTLSTTRLEAESGSAKVEVTDILGNRVYSSAIPIEDKYLFYELDIRNLSAGTYFIRITTEIQVLTQKVIKN